MTNLEDVIKKHYLLIAEGAVIERIRREFPLKLDPHIANAGFVYTPKGQSILAKIYNQYIDAVRPSGFPLILFTPTWRANPERIKLAGITGKNVNADCFRFLDDIRKRYRDYFNKIFIGGLLGCRGDAYNPREALSPHEAFAFHKFQSQALANTGVDFLFAATLPALSEAVGFAQAMSDTGVTYILSFVVRPNGTLLDGTSLHDAITTIDAAASPKPFAYMVNCIHPSNFHSAIISSNSRIVEERIIGLQANTSTKSPAELDERNELDTTEPNAFAEQMLGLHKQFGLKILGGCCGTNQRHIKSLVERANKQLG